MMNQEIKQKLVKTRLRLFMALAAKHGRICWYCQTPLQFKDAQIDHIVPNARNGDNKLPNLALSCQFCNRAKWDKPLEEFLAWLKKAKKPVPAIVERGKVPEATWHKYGNDIAKGLRKV